MNKNTLLAAAMLTATPFASAISAHAGEFGISTNVGFESKYVFRGVQFADTSMQPSVELSYGGFYGGAWFNLPVGHDAADEAFFDPFAQELDLYGGYSSSLTETISYDIGVTYYTFPEAANGFFDGDANTVEMYLGFAFDVILSPEVYFFRDFTLDTTTIQGGASYSVPLMEKTSFDVGGTIGYVIADNGADNLYGILSADISYAISDSGSFYVGGRYGGTDIPGGSMIDDIDLATTTSSDLWWGLGFSASF